MRGPWTAIDTRKKVELRVDAHLRVRTRYIYISMRGPWTAIDTRKKVELREDAHLSCPKGDNMLL